MKKNLILLFAILIASVVYSQKSVYFNPGFEGHPFEHIDKIAILPVTTPISSLDMNVGHLSRNRRTSYSSSSSQDLNADQLKQLQNSKSIEYQNDFYSSLLERDDLNGKIQNTKITNAILNKNKIGINSIGNYTPKQLAKILNVDAILYGSITRRISGYSRHASNIIHCVVSLSNKNNIQIWQYNISEAKSLKKSVDNLIATVLKRAMKEFPSEYKEKNSKIKNFFKHK